MRASVSRARCADSLNESKWETVCYGLQFTGFSVAGFNEFRVMKFGKFWDWFLVLILFPGGSSAMSAGGYRLWNKEMLHRCSTC